VPTLYKVILFGVFALAFDIVEHVTRGLIHGETLWASLWDVVSIGRNEFLARVLVVVAAFIPFFAFTEFARYSVKQPWPGCSFAESPHRVRPTGRRQTLDAAGTVGPTPLSYCLRSNS
jgi:hypothetical protein